MAVLAGAVQGLTEFLPISSTGHLIIFENIFGLSQENFGLSFDASLHLGTFFAVSVFFFKDYLQLFKLKDGLLVKLIVATLPAAIFGLLFESAIESTLRQISVVAVALISFSPVLILAEIYSQKTKKKDSPTIKNSFIIGLFQSLALIPGISRSGSTISAGLFVGLRREQAARFAFILSGPIIAAAGTKKFLEVLTSSGGSSINIDFFIIGIISSAFFGYLTIKYLLKYLSTNSLYPFVIYRIVLGILLLTFPF